MSKKGRRGGEIQDPYGRKVYEVYVREWYYEKCVYWGKLHMNNIYEYLFEQKCTYVHMSPLLNKSV